MNKNIFNKLTTYLAYTMLTLSTVLNMYAILGDKYLDIYTGYLMIFLYLLMIMFSGRSIGGWKKIPNALRFYFLYNLFISGISNINAGWIEMLSLTLLITIFSYIVYWDTFVYVKFLKFYATVVVAAVGFLFFQNFVKFTTGYGVSGVIPFLNTSKGLSENEALRQVYEYDRFPSFFSEPSHLAQILAPFLIILVLDKSYKPKHRNLLISVVLISMLLTQSGTAMMLLGPLTMFIFIDIWKRYKKKKIIVYIVSGCLFVVGYYIASNYLASDMGAFVNERSSEITNVSADDEGTSGFIRMWRGYFVFADYSVWEMIFGNPNYNSIIGHVYRSNMQLYLEDFALTYFNGVQRILIHTGFIGLGLFAYYVITLWRDNTICGKCLILTMLVLMLIESIFGTTRMALFLLLIQYQKISRNYEEQSYYNIRS